MKIKEYKLISKKENGTFPQLEYVAEHNVIYDDVYLYFHHNNYEFEYMFFGDTLKLQDNYTEFYYIMAYNESGNPIGIIQISSGGRNKTIISFDVIFTFLLLIGSKSFISIHNHPNNNSEKSYEDITTDNIIKTLSQMLDINYKEGLIITKKKIIELHQKIDSFEKYYLENDN